MKDNGFTLIELAIVMIIVGLIIGGILAGQRITEEANNRETSISCKHKQELEINNEEW